MNENMIKSAFAIILITLIIYIVKNIDYLKKIYNNFKARKEFFALKLIFFSIIILLFVYIFIREGIYILDNIQFYSAYKANNEMFNECDKKIENENDFYNKSILGEYEDKYNIPYIPDSFKYKEGEWNNGFVIEDVNGNEYVWVPCTNKKETDVPILERIDFIEYDLYVFTSKDTCYNKSYKDFIKSALENGGFYISRYEMGIEDDKLVSKKGAPIYGDVTREEGINKINQLYDNKNFKCELINGYAYDTTLSWIKSNNDIEFQKYNKIENKDILNAGRKSYNNIFDFTDNILEYSLEDCYDTQVIRGFCYEEKIEGRTRYTITSDSKDFDSFSVIGFRTIIYK